MTLLPSPWRFGKINFLHFPSLPEVSVSSTSTGNQVPLRDHNLWGSCFMYFFDTKAEKDPLRCRNIYRQKAVPSFSFASLCSHHQRHLCNQHQRSPYLLIICFFLGSSKADISLLNRKTLIKALPWAKSLIQPQVKHESPLLKSFLCEPCIKGPGRVCSCRL